MEKEISLEEMKKMQVSILKYIKDVCAKNDLQYYLCGGTLLGAVRHGGFIPWDDDIDIFMLREDYMKLLDILRHTTHDSFAMMSYYDNDDYCYPFAKVINKNTCMTEENLPYINGYGIYVDIFPIDGLPNEESKCKRYFKKMLFLRDLLNLSTNIKYNKPSVVIKNIYRYPIWLICRCISFRKFLKLIDKNAMKHKTKDSNFVACSVAGYGKKEILPSQVFDKTIMINFENEEFNAPIGYEIYLSNLYGDYMKLPPKEKRISHHKFKAWWKNAK